MTLKIISSHSKWLHSILNRYWNNSKPANYNSVLSAAVQPLRKPLSKFRSFHDGFPLRRSEIPSVPFNGALFEQHVQPSLKEQLVSESTKIVSQPFSMKKTRQSSVKESENQSETVLKAVKLLTAGGGWAKVCSSRKSSGNNLTVGLSRDQFKAASCGEDAYFCQSYALGVADGVGGWNNVVGSDASLFAHLLLHYAAKQTEKWYQVDLLEDDEDECSLASDLDQSLSLKQLDLCPVQVMESSLVRIPKSVIGSTTACIGTLSPRQTLQIAHIGDCGLLVIRQNDIVFRTEEMQYEFNYPFQIGSGSPLQVRQDAARFEIPLERGDVVVMGSDGLFDNLFDDEILEGVALQMKQAPARSTDYRQIPEQIRDVLLERALRVAEDKHASSPFSQKAIEHGQFYRGGKLDDITIVIGIVADDEDSPDRR